MRTGMFLGGGSIDAGKEHGETTTLLLVVEAKQVQKCVEALDVLKVSNPRLQTVVVTTKWETFDNSPPVTTKWEIFD
uniref:Uncharacterized protein n=1 Tax=Aegilops tauschii TaxID=37682 RepID=M8BYZ0_AEGTA